MRAACAAAAALSWRERSAAPAARPDHEREPLTAGGLHVRMDVSKACSSGLSEPSRITCMLVVVMVVVVMVSGTGLKEHPCRMRCSTCTGGDADGGVGRGWKGNQGGYTSPALETGSSRTVRQHSWMLA
eukprot:1138379-Pelagomonas_calceolata.AAC.3